MIADANSNNISIIVELLKKHKISKVVISPGGTNIAFVKAVQDDKFFTCYSVVDERSAIYFAIGMYLQTGEIIATSCTSAQATRNYIPGLTEAFYKRVPILAITMAKHPRFTYQEYMQAPDQASLPNDCVKKSFSVPYINDKNDVLYSIRVVNEAINELSFNDYGPVQLCIPWLDFQLDESELSIRKIDIFSIEDNIANLNLENKRILLVIGEHRPFTDDEKKEINDFCRNNDVVVYTNHLSNFKNEYSLNANLLLATMKANEFAQTLIPDVMITIGGQTGDYPFYKMFCKPHFASIEHWRVAKDGKIIDTYDKLTKVFHCSDRFFFNTMKGKVKSSHEFYKSWKRENDNKTLNIKLPFSNAAIAQYLHNKIPENSIIQFSILNSLRIWSFFDLNRTISCYSNVGAFGIDGGMSTLIGQSVISKNLSFIIIGDLAFYYDMNAIGIRHIKNNVRILLINNNGGIEFKLSGDEGKDFDRYIAAGNHFKNADGWARTCGFTYLSADNMNDFINNSDIFLGESESPILFEIFVTDKNEAEAYTKIININTNRLTSEIIKDDLKKSAKKVLRQHTIKQIKGIFTKR